MTDERLAVLRDDLATIDNIDRQLIAYQEDMRRQFAYHLTRVENIIARMLQRGDAFFEETIRLGRVFDLLNKDKIRGEFERQVVAGTEQQIDTVVDELIDWMVDQDLKIWKSVTDYIDRRRLTQYEEGLIGEVGGQFRYDRRALLESVARRTQEEVDRYDLDAEANELAESVRNAVATVAVAEAGAVGLGALVVAAASTVAVDVTGILAASLLAGLGLFVLPNKRRQAKRDFHAKAEELEQRLIEVMREQFEHELARSMDRVREAISPYTRFVRSQFEHLEQMRTQLTAVDNDMRALRHRIGASHDSQRRRAGSRATGRGPAGCHEKSTGRRWTRSSTPSWSSAVLRSRTGPVGAKIRKISPARRISKAWCAPRVILSAGEESRFSAYFFGTERRSFILQDDTAKRPPLGRGPRSPVWALVGILV